MAFTRLNAGTVVAFLTLALGACSDDMSSGDDGLWSANPDRLGPITADTAFNQQALAEALPGFTVSAATSSAEGVTYPVFEASRADADAAELVIDGDHGRLLAVTVRVPGLVRAAADIGDSAATGAFMIENCFPGMEERSGDVVCQHSRPTGLTYWIAVDHTGPDGELPAADLLNAGQVYEIQWVPVPDRG